jgi:hypothetical protein
MEGHMLSADDNIVRVRDMRGIVEEIPREKISTIRLTARHRSNRTGRPATSTNAVPEAPEEQGHFCSLVASFQESRFFICEKRS